MTRPSAPDWDEVLKLFDALVDLPDPARCEQLDVIAVTQPELAAEVASMLTADQREPGILEASLEQLAPELNHAIARQAWQTAPGTEFGPFRLVEHIGEGGMGEVWLAERIDGNYQQNVAVKLLKRGLDTEAVLRRFVQERAILARLQHPAIVRLIDGGMSPDGRPWYAMEPVEGQPITDWAASQGLDPRQLVALMIEVCAAVAHAHGQLIVHRDLKPANILVDQEGRPRLLDFGIAKLLEESAESEQTRTNVRILSPAWAAPEQIKGEPVSVATDIHALGLVLYQLLTGQLPERTGDDALPAPASRTIARLSMDTGQQLFGPTADPRRIARQVAGDLDLILAMALRPEPERRYASVSALATDLEAWLSGRPVSARPDSRGYRLRRFVRRNLVGVSAAAAAALALTLGLALALWQAGFAREQAVVAALETQRATRSLDFLVGLLQASNPRSGERIESIEQLLNMGGERALSSLDDDPLLQGTVLLQLADARAGRSEYEESMALNLAARERLTAVLQPPNHLLARSAYLMGVAVENLEGSREAVDWMQEAASQAEQLGDFRLQFRSLGHILNYQITPETVDRLDAVLAQAELVLADDPVYLARLRADYAQIALNQHDLGRSEALLKAALPVLERAGDVAYLDRLYALSRLAGVFDALGRQEEAMDYFEQALAAAEAFWGPQHEHIASLLFSQGILLATLDRYPEAEVNYRRVLATDNISVLLVAHAHRYLGIALTVQARYEEAVVELQTALDRYLAIGDDMGQSQAMRALADLGVAQVRLGDEQGFANLREAIAGLERLRGQEHYEMLQPLLRLGQLLGEAGRPQEAATELYRARRLAHALLGRESWFARHADELLARLGPEFVNE